jgi:hypothetical protein
LVLGTIFSGLLVPATFVADCIAVGWVGLWLGMRQRKPNQAFLLTVAWVLFVPKILFCIPDILLDLAFIYWARQRLQAKLRESVSARLAFEVPDPGALLWAGSRKHAAALPPVVPSQS